MQNLRVLVVDDEPGMRLGIARALSKFRVHLEDFASEFGFVIDECPTGAEALRLLASKKYDLILLDYKLPDIGGLDILAHISEEKYDLLTIMITAFASLEVAVSATKHGAFDFLAKPFSTDELKSAVRKTVNSLMLQRQARQLAEEKRQVRFQFLSVLSHELKAPLNAIEGYLRIIDEKAAGDDLEQYEHMVKRSLLRIEGMRKLIFDMLDLTRIESGQKARELRLVNLLEPARKAIENALPDAEKRGIKIELKAAENVSLNADMGEVEIIFNNLVSNAVKYNKDGGSVTVSVAPSDGGVEISVADTGIGLKPEEKERLFGEFVRIKNDQTRNIPGSGLGLSILKRLSTLYHGDVSVSSEWGVGSTFTVLLRDAKAFEATPLLSSAF